MFTCKWCKRLKTGMNISVKIYILEKLQIVANLLFFVLTIINNHLCSLTMNADSALDLLGHHAVTCKQGGDAACSFVGQLAS